MGSKKYENKTRQAWVKSQHRNGLLSNRRTSKTSNKDAKQNKTKQNVANEYKHRKQTNNLNNSTQEKKAKDTRNLWKKNNSREGRPVMHVDQKNI